MRTAYIHRPTEYGPAQSKDLRAEEDWDVIVPGVDRLADTLLGEQTPARPA
jgi:2-haloacid dehalogenase